MYRIRFRLPKRALARYRNIDLIHDALVNAWCTAGAQAESVIGGTARPWTFAPLGFHRSDGNLLHTLVVSTPDPLLSEYLPRLDPAWIVKLRPTTGEAIDLTAAERMPDPAPIAPQQGHLPALLLSPLAVRRPDSRRWQTSLAEFDLSAAINHRLSRVAGHPVHLEITPDPLYLRANPRHSVMIPLKRMADGQRAFVIGMSAPLTLSGSDADLALAWYAGLGEKNRNGFGCVGLAGQGIGR